MNEEKEFKPRTEWADPPPDPAEFRQNDEESVPAPGRPALNKVALHGPLGEITKVISPNTEADPVAIFIQLLAAFGNNIGRQAFFRVEQTRHHSNIYANLVGHTSVGRKGTALDYVKFLFRHADLLYMAQFAAGLSTGEGLIDAVRDPFKDDAGVEDKRLLVIESEFVKPIKVMARPQNTLSPVIREGWDGGNLRIMNRNSPARATNAHISIIGHITPDELLRELPECDLFNGFANRFLWAFVERVQLLPEGGKIAPEIAEALVSQLQEALMRARTIVGEVVRDNQAREQWRAMYQELTTTVFPGALGAVVDRGAAQIVRLSLILALADGSPVITLTHQQAALALWDYCVQSARRLFGDRLSDPRAQKILDALRRHPEGMTRKQILDEVFTRNISSDRLRAALQVLLDYKLAKRVIEPTEGKSAERWFAVTPF